jgi:hypothetical protein
MCSEHFTLLQARSGFAHLARTKEDRTSASFISRPTKVFGSLGDEGLFCETTAYDPLALLRLQGGLGPSGARLASHVRPAGRADQLLAQLRPVSFPEKLIPLIIINASRPQAARLRQGRERARLGSTSTITRARYSPR